MFRLIIFLLSTLVVAAGLAWLADRPGTLLITWQDYEIETTVFRAVVLLVVLSAVVVALWSLLRQLWLSPATVGNVIMKRRQKRGLESLSSGMIAVGAGDRALATRYAAQARKSLPNEPLTHVLRAQAAQLSGDKQTARRIFEAMLNAPDTEQLGLRGLFLEAERVGETEGARQFAERAVRLNPKLGWSVEALFDIQCRQAHWEGALETLALARRFGHVEKPVADRRRAVLLAGQSQNTEESDPDKALTLALEAHGLAPDLVPAAAVAGRLLAARGNTPRATKIIQRTWVRSPHPELATAYAYARIGDSPRDRLDRVKQLAALTPNSIEGPVAVATAAIEARQFEEARTALEPLLDHRLTQRVATLMARIEGEQYGDKGRVREWLARAVSAPRDPAWTADGVVAEHWAPASPVTGALDAFRWRVPVETLEEAGSGLVTHRLETMIALGASSVEATDTSEPENEHVASAEARPSQQRVIEAVDADIPIGPAVPAARTKPAGKGSTDSARRLVEGKPSNPATEDTGGTAGDLSASQSSETSAARRDKTRPGRSRNRGDATAARGPEPQALTPRAPDDPGPEPSGLEDHPQLRPYRATS